MPNITEIKGFSKNNLARKRVAAYARVSEETERLHHSISAQVSFYSNLIQARPEWEYAGVYADEGITGTSTDRRKEFLRLMEDCEAGKIDLILTKSISRFARNTVDLLKTVRHLKSLGIEVRFEKEGISTFDGTGEVMLTLLASFAQEESRSNSENTKWAIQKRFQQGKPRSRFRIYGYEWKEDLLVPVPEEAEVVRRIFDAFLNGKTIREIRKELNQESILKRGRHWYDSSVMRILENITYTGDLMLQKVFYPDALTKKKLKNEGQLPMYLVSGSHEAIIPAETFHAAELEFQRRKDDLFAVQRLNGSCFTFRMKCGHCGKSFVRGSRKDSKGNNIPYWHCSSDCGMPSISENRMIATCDDALNGFTPRKFSQEVLTVTFYEDRLEFHMRDGSAASHPKHKSARWTEESRMRQSETMRMQAAEGRFYPFTSRLYDESTGLPYRRYAEKRPRWRVTGRKSIIEEELKKVSAEVLGEEEFDADSFTKRIEKITVSDDLILTYLFTDGTVRKAVLNG